MLNFSLLSILVFEYSYFYAYLQGTGTYSMDP